MDFVAASGDVVGVDIKDDVAAYPALLVHVKIWVIIISATMVNIRGYGLGNYFSKTLYTIKALVAHHEAFFKHEIGEFTSLEIRWRGNSVRWVAVKLAKLLEYKFSRSVSAHVVPSWLELFVASNI